MAAAWLSFGLKFNSFQSASIVTGMITYSIIRSLQGVGLIVTSSGRVMLVMDTTAWPGARFGS